MGYKEKDKESLIYFINFRNLIEQLNEYRNDEKPSTEWNQ